MKVPEVIPDPEGTSTKDDEVPDKSLTDEELVKTSVVPSDGDVTYGTRSSSNNGYVTSGHGNGIDVGQWHLDDHMEGEGINGHEVNPRLNGSRHFDSKFNGHTPGNVPVANGKNNTLMDRFVSEKQRSGIKDLMEALRRLLKNPVIVYGALADFTALVAEFGMFIWLPKYQEHQFRVTKSVSTFFSGISSTTSLLLGVFGGGIWIYRFRPKARTVAYFMTLGTAVYLLSLVGLMFVTCDFQDDLPGILSPDGGSVELYRGCSTGCDCNLKEFIPVCVRDGPISLTYFSPCHAGCPDSSLTQNTNDFAVALQDKKEAVEVFLNCTCGSPSAKVTSGYCQDTCSGFIAYNAIMIIVKSFISIGIIGGTLINMRCVAAEDKSLALGIKTMMLSAALIANPLIYGLLVDSTCLVWEETCQGRGSCWLYNTDDFRYKLHGVSAIFFFFSIIFIFVVARKIGDLQLLDEDSSSSDSSTSSPTSSFLFSGPGAGRKSSLRRSLKKISRMVGRENGISKSPERKREQQESRETEDVDKQQEEHNRSERGHLEASETSVASQRSSPPFPQREILPSRIVKTTGV